MATKNTINLLFDDTFTFTLLEDDNITPVSLSSIADVIILFKVNEQEVLKFKSTIATGYKQWTQDITNDHKLHCKVERAETTLFPEGELKAELVIVENDTDFQDNLKYNSPIELELGYIRNTQLKGVINDN